MSIFDQLLAGIAGGAEGFGRARSAKTAREQKQHEMDIEEAKNKADVEYRNNSLAAQKDYQDRTLAEETRFHGSQTRNMEDLRERQRINDYADAASKGDVNYLDPEKAYRMNQRQTIGVGSMEMPDVASPAINAMRSATQSGYLSQIEPTAQKLSHENRSSGFLPGSEAIGGATITNRTFSPFGVQAAGMRTDESAANRESMDVSRARDDIEAAGRNAAKMVSEDAGLLKIVGPEELTRRANIAAEKARKTQAQSISSQLSRWYPRNASLYTPEALMGQAPAARPQGSTTPSAPNNSDPLGIGGPPRQTHAPTATPQRKPQLVNSADPLGIFSGRP